MKRVSLIIALFTVACGGGSKHPGPVIVDEPDDNRVEPIEDEEPVEEPEPPPPPPQVWHATAQLAPVKGSKMKPAVLHFSQTEGEAATMASDAALTGLKPGRYHVVFHEGGDCGKNAAKAGAAWSELAEAVPPIVIAKGANEAVSASDLALVLDGDQTIVGHAIVIHEDKKGKPGKAMACGVVLLDTEEDDSAAE